MIVFLHDDSREVAARARDVVVRRPLDVHYRNVQQLRLAEAHACALHPIVATHRAPMLVRVLARDPVLRKGDGLLSV